MSSEQEFWAAETARRMAEYNRRALAAAQQQRATLAAQPDYGLDGARHRANRDYETMLQGRYAEAARAHAAAVAAKHARLGYVPLSELDWDALSTESRIDQMHAEDAAAQQAQQQSQRDAINNLPGVRLQRWRDYLATRAGQRAVEQHDAEDEIPSWFR